MTFLLVFMSLKHELDPLHMPGSIIRCPHTCDDCTWHGCTSHTAAGEGTPFAGKLTPASIMKDLQIHLLMLIIGD